MIDQTIQSLQERLATLDTRAAPLRRQLLSIEQEAEPLRARLSALLQEDRELASREALLRSQLADVETRRKAIAKPVLRGLTRQDILAQYLPPLVDGESFPTGSLTTAPDRQYGLVSPAEPCTPVLPADPIMTGVPLVEVPAEAPTIAQEPSEAQESSEDAETPPEAFQGPPEADQETRRAVNPGARTRQLVRDGVQPEIGDLIVSICLKAGTPLSGAEVCTAVERSGYISEARKLEDSVTPALSKLVAAGRLHRPSPGRYEVTAAEANTRAARQRAEAASHENGVPVLN